MGVSTTVFVNFKDFSQDNLHIVKDKLIDCCDVMIVYVPNDCESNSDNIVVKGFN